ncbi:MAG: hypothetical protein O2955_13575 [Planctomycetota bacterium]|nr:hypothetical protein [Planctomycetota bacterium]MDA1213539.1 hypothetical protein [Planctomycetota bacterium]
MKSTSICPKCGSSDIIADAKAIDYGDGNMRHDMHVATYAEPHAVFFKGEHKTKVSAWVCATCGFVEFYADSQASLKIG